MYVQRSLRDLFQEQVLADSNELTQISLRSRNNVETERKGKNAVPIFQQ